METGVSQRQRQGKAPLLFWDNRYRTKHYGSSKVRHKTPHRIEAFFCLLTIIAQLVLAVAHSWEVPVDAGVTSATPAFQKDASGATIISKAATVPRRTSHDPLLCSVCRLLSQVKNGIALHGPRIFPLQTHLTVLLDSAFHSSGIDHATSAPRAPPYFL
jgi:hypothetical protein